LRQTHLHAAFILALAGLAALLVAVGLAAFRPRAILGDPILDLLRQGGARLPRRLAAFLPK
jgi:hypothetical protein